jgi:aspartyl aminopeptidase
MHDLNDLLDFIGDSPTPYHAVESAIRRLEAAGFARLDETAGWSEVAGGRWFVEQGGSALAAFVVPGKDARAVHMIGAHTDSPNLRLKPAAPFLREGYLQVGVEVYGGALLNSWLDRDLGIAGRVIVEEDGKLVSRLLRFDRPLARVAQLAIHLDRDVNEKGVVLNRQNHLVPIIGLEGADLAALAGEGRLDLMLYDLARPAVGGLGDEFIFSARLDNLAMCHAATTALIATAAADTDTVRMAVLFDHEEVGSQSATGAGSGFLPRLLERITLALGCDRERFHRILAASVCISADMAHAIHPNYADRHEPNHRPMINRGPVIKLNTQQRYATSARTAALFERLCREADVPVQNYVHRTDLQCGSTIGPITSTLLGIETVDVGNPMLSMHSIREMGGSQDPAMMGAAMEAFYRLPTGW